MNTKKTSPVPASDSPEIRQPEMLAVPEGYVLMGTSDDQVQDLLRSEEWADEWVARGMFQTEQPQNTVDVAAFEIARFPSTNADYQEFVWDTGHRVPRSWMGFHYLEEEALNPVVEVSRGDALAYCEWLSDRVGLLGTSRYRLPTEAEWERAARGEDDCVFPWGDAFDPWRCNTQESNFGGTTAVGIFSPSGDSPWGVADMAGNVWEWTSCLLKPYPYDSQDGREDLNAKGVCVVRGGSWYYSRKLARCASREGVLVNFTSPALGFRLARTP